MYVYIYKYTVVPRYIAVHVLCFHCNVFLFSTWILYCVYCGFCKPAQRGPPTKTQWWNKEKQPKGQYNPDEGRASSSAELGGSDKWATINCTLQRSEQQSNI